ncbi:hypothetical protein CPB83DRAFT_859704 [Crepidotus variabilis]|uniref:NmrA-like domain-containing protein n=1 Tax=Crepidotus variabilis TaxID=179855 RepID=A0A9P6JLN6_9AGAR|nr:hypothetical protein CPB83DRAFT_859704 [Crepidotus variabilis]
MTVTSEPTAPLFTVVGATGAQGASTIRALQASTKAYRIRAITRDSSKPSAKKLEELGCEVVQADIDGNAGATKAFAGSDYVFGMTLSDYNVKANEYKKGQVQVDAAKAAGVKTFIWSSELHLGRLSGGKIEVPLFEVKAEIADYARSLELNIIEVCPGTFVSSYIALYPPRKQADGSYLLSLPSNSDTKLPPIDIEFDFGKYVVAALETNRITPVLAASEYITAAEIAEAFSKVSGQEVRFSKAEDEPYRQRLASFVGEGMAADILNMSMAFRTIGYYAQQDLADSNAILPTPARTFVQSLEARKVDVLKAMGL